MLSVFAKVFERKVWRVKVSICIMQLVHFQVRSSRYFLSTNLGKDLFRYLCNWYCGKKTNRMWFSLAQVKLHWFEINWQVLIHRNAEIVACINRTTSQIWKVLPNMVFPSIWGEKWRRSEHAQASYPGLTGLSFRPPGFSEAGRKESSGTGLCCWVNDSRKENGLKPQWVWKKEWVCLLVVGVH